MRISELPFSLKQLLIEKEEVITSPVKHKPETASNFQLGKKKQVDFGSKYSVRGEKSNGKS